MIPHEPRNATEAPMPESALAHDTKMDLPRHYRIVEVSFDTHSDVMLRLWQAGLGHDGKADEKFHWYYRCHNVHAPTILLLEHVESREFVGTASIAPRAVRIGERIETVGVMVDFVVLPLHRTLFPAMLLMRAVHERGLTLHPFVYGLPNPKSQAVVRRTGYTRIGDMTRYSRVLRSAPYLKKHMPQWLATAVGAIMDRIRVVPLAIADLVTHYPTDWIEQPDARFDELWNRAKFPALVMGSRDARFLAWRFVECPLSRHQFFVLTCPTSGKLVAYAVCEFTPTVLDVHDFLADPSIPNALPSLWRQLQSAAYRMGYNSVTTDFMGSATYRSCLRRAGFVARNKRPVYGVARREHHEVLATTPWYLTSADEDG